MRPVAGVILRNDAGEVLLMRRSGEGTWGIPGGGLEAYESWESAAVRECQEETGWQIRIDGLLGIYSDPATQTHQYPDGSVRHFVGVVFLATAAHRVGQPDHESTELRWIQYDSLPAPLFGPDEPVLRDYFDGPGRVVIG